MVTMVDVRDVTKVFTLRRTQSLKESVVKMLRGPRIGSERAKLKDDFTALDQINFQVRTGEIVGLLGLNGSGKSTLLKLISGVLKPDEGSVRVRGQLAGLIDVGAGFHPDLSGRENVFLNGAILGMDAEKIEARFDEIVDFSEIGDFIDTQVKYYSAGMFLRLAFAVAVHTEPDVLLIDEILAVGDEPFQRKCLTRIDELHSRGCTLVIVSHDLNLMERICTRAVVLRNGRIVADGEPAAVIEELRGR